LLKTLKEYHDMMRKIAIIHEFTSFPTPKNEIGNIWSEINRKSIEFNYIEMLKDGILEVNPDFPHKELSNFLYSDIHHVNFIG